MFPLLLAPLLACTGSGRVQADGTFTITDAGNDKTIDQTDDTLPPVLDSGTVPLTVETGDTAPPTDCSALPSGPFGVCSGPTDDLCYATLTGYSTAEDFDFDGDGYAASNYSDSLVGKNRVGDTKLIKPNVGGWTAGTRVLPTGDWVIADAGQGAMLRIDVLTGAETVIGSGMSYPNGVEVDAASRVYVADQTQGNVRMMDAYTLEEWPVASGLSAPNGVILSPDDQVMYVGSFGGGLVYAIDRISDTEWDTPRVLYDPSSNDGGFDGINVDSCGNVYISEYTTGKIFRVDADGLNPELMADLPSFWVPNMRWGVGDFDWESDSLYVADRDQGRLFEIRMGVEGKRHLLAP